MLGVVAFAVGGSYSKISNSCVFFQRAVGKHLFQMVVDGVRFNVIEQPHHLLGEPDVFICVHRFHAAIAAGCPIADS